MFQYHPCIAVAKLFDLCSWADLSTVSSVGWVNLFVLICSVFLQSIVEMRESLVLAVWIDAKARYTSYGFVWKDSGNPKYIYPKYPQIWCLIMFPIVLTFSHFFLSTPMFRHTQYVLIDYRFYIIILCIDGVRAMGTHGISDFRTRPVCDPKPHQLCVLSSWVYKNNNNNKSKE